MDIKTKIKTYMKKENPQLVAAQAIVVTVTLIAYTLTCRLSGYRMVKPVGNDANNFYVQSISGSILHSPISK